MSLVLSPVNPAGLEAGMTTLLAPLAATRVVSLETKASSLS
jgi:hypothetical protein